jgi:hypothetical protein
VQALEYAQLDATTLAAHLATIELSQTEVIGAAREAISER